MSKTFIGLGTNIGNRSANLREAIDFLADMGIIVKKESAVYETEPIGVVEQGWFYNMVVEADAETSPEGLLLKAKSIEQEMGREESTKWGPRLIDIDVLLYDNLVLETKVDGHELRLPHPELINRAFVILPLLEIEPKAKLPGGSKIDDYVQATEGQKVKKIGRLEELDE